MNTTMWEPDFKVRLHQYNDELKWLFCELYGEDMQAYGSFCQMMAEAYASRKPELREQDVRRAADPGWYHSGGLLGMMMYTNAFAGTLKGVQDKLSYIQECGVNYLHLMPLLQSPRGRSDGGYAVADFRTVQPELGTMEDLEALADECRYRHIDLCLDFVMNHTSEDHEWARRAKAGDPEYQKRYFFYDDWEIPNQFEKTVPQVFPTTAPGNFTYNQESGKVVMTTFYPYQWDLNYGNPAVFQDMVDTMLNLVNRGISIIRIDAVPYIWKKLGTSCRNLQEVHNIVRMVRIVCEIVCPGVLLLGEVVMEPVKVAPYFGTVEKPECHMLYNVTTMCTTWHTLATRDVRLLRYQMDQVSSLPRESVFLNYLRCHDDIGWGLDYDFLRRFGMQEAPHKKFLSDYYTGIWPDSLARGELYNDDPASGDARQCGTTASLCGMEVDPGLGLACDEMLHAYMLTQSGIPMLYSGDEVLQLNDYTYHDDPEKCDDSRYIHRGDFRWDQAALRHDAATPQGRFFRFLRRLEQLRAEHPVFSGDASMRTLETHNTAVLGLMRQCDEETLVALFNFSEKPQALSLDMDLSGYTDLLTGEPVFSMTGLDGYGFRWLLR